MSLILPLRMSLTLTLISNSLPVASFLRMLTFFRLARSVKPPAWAMAWVSVGSRQHGQVSSLSSLRSGWGAVGPVHEWKLIP